MIVRRATPADADAIAEVHTISSETAYAAVASPEPGGLERRRAMWADVLAIGRWPPLVAEIDGRIVGFADAGPGKERDDVGELHAIYVHPDAWGTGVGQALLDASESALAEHWSEAILTALVANPRARRFYERNDWRFVERWVEPHFGGLEVEVCRYAKRLSTSRSPS